MTIKLDYTNTVPFVSEKEIDDVLIRHHELLRTVLAPDHDNSNDLGWVDLTSLANDRLLESIEIKAREIRERGDIFVLIGVGGSNQGARAVIKSLGDKHIEILYVGNNLSPRYLKTIMAKLAGKSVYVNIIAKNFATLEPGITFRVFRQYLEERYGREEASQRIIATGSLNGSSLEELGKKKGYTLMPFPLNVGGRYSVLSAVGLLPIAVSGVGIRELLRGAKDIKQIIHSQSPEKNDAVIYAVIRNILLTKGYQLEILAHFEPALAYFAKWWVQLFGETEGKEGKGLYPTSCSFTEDLHSLGQYIQEGQRLLLETFINLEDQGETFRIPAEDTDIDGFNYLNNLDFAYLNKNAYEATVQAHVDGGVPCFIVNVPELTPYYMGQLLYFFEYACYLSASLLGVNPFDQPGVEAYKEKMFAQLKG
ncbi:glucose-6-phosphate isomerase [Desulfosporosinus sp. SYSU MS00001]|uniref:glucose-6-phosphate isomerase n=1 Tax=Desulfosporosinus sp. SYSU MS00001 TaxID=3416284 RepID=UPI003CF7ED66